MGMVAVAVLDHDVAALDVAKVTEALEEACPHPRINSCLVGPHPADPSDPVRRLRLGGTRRGEDTRQRGQQEAAPLHAGMVGHALVRSQTSWRWGYSSPSQRRASSTVEKILMSPPL
jgi:hypothetical protein